MAKALAGFMGATSPADLHELALLRRKVSELQAEVERLRTENDQLLAVQADRVEVEFSRETVSL